MPLEKDFFYKVHEVAKLIPKGKVTSYGAIAAYLGAKKSSRMVGYAMNAAHSIPEIPAHRVVNRNGQLSGKAHFNNPSQMQELLEIEGHIIEDDTILGFEKVFWDPIRELI